MYRLIESGFSKSALEQVSLLTDVVVFKQKFYPSGWANYSSATLDGLVLQPSEYHMVALKADFEQMQEMLFGNNPSFDDILKALIDLENEIHTLAL